MKEQDKERDPYWQEDTALGEGRIDDEQYGIRLRLHTSAERYQETREIVSLKHRRGERIYCHGRPYILQPEITLSIGVYPEPRGDQVGEVLSSEWEGMRHQDIGNAQAWYYPAEQTLVLWECYLFDLYREENPLGDEVLASTWAGFERWLLSQFPETRRLVTPCWENTYERDHWQAFLAVRGYHAFNERAFLKTVPSSR